MRSFSSRAALFCVILTGLTAGCASTRPSPAAEERDVVTSEEFQSPTESIVSVLQRKAPGLVVTRTSDGGVALQIRGTSSFRGEEKAPLYILNGAPFQPGPGGALTGIDPREIETIKVLRSAEAGIYGIEGANGVIIITTKRAGTPRS